MRFFALIFSFFCLLAVSFAHQSDSIRQSNVQNGRHQRHALNQEQTREERGTFRSPNSNSDQNPDKGSKAKRGVSRFGEAPIEREMTGNVSPVEAARSSGAVAPTYAAAQPYSAAQSVAAAFPAAPPVQAVPAVAAVGRKRRATSRNSPVETQPLALFMSVNLKDKTRPPVCMRTLSFSRVFRIKRVVVFVVVTLLYLFSHRIQPSSPQVQNVKDTALRLLRDTFPHLRDVDPALLYPEVLLGSLRKKKLVIAIPVVERTKRSYLVQTLKWLLAWIDPGDRDLVNIMVFIRSSNDSYVEGQIERIRESFDRDTLGPGRDSVLQVLRTPERVHPDVDSIPVTFNDSRRRMNWRTRQNIDNLYMLSYAYPFGDYYLQLEDDQDSQKDYLKNIFFWLRVHHDRPWIMMRFASQGFIGKLFRSQDAYRLAQAISLYYVHKPVDWILSDFLHGQFCSPEWDQARCFQEIEMRTPIFVPSQFNHVGFHSSMKGKIHRELQKEVGFFGNSKRVEKGNPPAEIITDMRSGMDFTVEDVYNYTIFFYSDPPRKGQQIKIKLEMPTRLKAILLTTGRLTEPSEIFGESVQVQLFHGQEAVRQGHFTRQGRFERHLECIPVDEILITVTEDIEHDVILTNILVIPC